jgi:hypothetical protein
MYLAFEVLSVSVRVCDEAVWRDVMGCIDLMI